MVETEFDTTCTKLCSTYHPLQIARATARQRMLAQRPELREERSQTFGYPSLLMSMQGRLNCSSYLNHWAWLIAIWDRAFAFCALGALSPRPHLSCIIPFFGLSKSIALPMLGLDATGQQSSLVRTPGAGHGQAWPDRELDHWPQCILF